MYDNNNGNGKKVNHNLNGNGDRFHVVTPEDELTALHKEIASLREQNAYLKGLAEGLRENRESRIEKKPVESIPSAPATRPMPEEDKTINRIALCSELIRVLLDPDVASVIGTTPKLFHGEKKDRPRVYLAEDNSYLYFDKWGRIYAATPNKAKFLSRHILNKLFQMRDCLPSPILQAALLKSQFNPGVE